MPPPPSLLPPLLLPLDPLHPLSVLLLLPPSSEPSLYIAGLPTASTRDSLFTLLSPFGPLASLRILPLTPERVSSGAGGVNRGVAFARYARVEDAERAMEALSGMGRGEGGKGLTVRWATHNRGREVGGGLTAPPRMAGMASMEQVGAMDGAWAGYQTPMSAARAFDYHAMMMGGYGAAPTGYSTVELMAASNYAAAAYGLQMPYVIDPAYLYYAQAAAALASPVSAAGVGPMPILPASPSQLPSPSSSFPSSSLPPPATLTLFLCHLAPQLTDGGLFALFTPFGALTQCRVVRERDGRSKGYGFVSYHSTEECRAALQAMNGALVEGRAMKVQWKGEKGGGQVMGAGVGVDGYHQTVGWWGMGLVCTGQPVTA